MTNLAKVTFVLSMAALIMIVLPAVYCFLHPDSFGKYLLFVQIGTLIWFVTAPFWLIKDKTGS